MMVAVLAVAALLCQETTPPRTNPDPKAKAQELLSVGTAYYESGDFASALRLFTAAHSIYPSPKLWLNIGQALKDLDRPAEAMDAFQRFIAGAPSAPEEALAEAHRSVAELRPQLGGWILHCRPLDAEVTLDEKPLGQAPLNQPIWMTPGRHRLVVRREGYLPFTVTLHVNAGAVTSWPVNLEPVESPARPTPGPQPPFYRQWPFWAVAGGTILFAGIAMAASRN